MGVQCVVVVRKVPGEERGGEAKMKKIKKKKCVGGKLPVEVKKRGKISTVGRQKIPRAPPSAPSKKTLVYVMGQVLCLCDLTVMRSRWY